VYGTGAHQSGHCLAIKLGAIRADMLLTNSSEWAAGPRTNLDDPDTTHEHNARHHDCLPWHPHHMGLRGLLGIQCKNGSFTDQDAGFLPSLKRVLLEPSSLEGEFLTVCETSRKMPLLSPVVCLAYGDEETWHRGARKFSANCPRPPACLCVT
jgi:hypothetical protein